MNDFQIEPQKQIPGRSFGPPAQLYLPPKDNKKKTLIIVLGACAVLLAVILGGWFYHAQSPAVRVRKGFLNLIREMEERKNPLLEKTGAGAIRQRMAEEGYCADTRLNFTVDTGSYYLGELTLGVDTELEKDVRDKEMSASTTLSLMNYDFGHVEMYADRENFCFSVPEFLLDGLYIENENVLEQYNDSMWVLLFGEAEGDDFSIDLFADQWLFADEEGVVSAFLKEYAEEIAECGRHMTIEKAGGNLYRVSFDELYFNELVRQVLYDYVDFSIAGREEAMGALNYFNVISNPDEISFLLEISSKNRIESIRIEEPLSLYQGGMQISGDIYFLGEACSIDKMQGKIGIRKDLAEKTGDYELTWQVVQSLVAENYQMKSNIRYRSLEDGEKADLGLDCDLECDGRKDSFAADISLKAPSGGYQLTTEGSLSHIKKGEGFSLKLDELLLLEEDEEVLLVRGNIGLQPLVRRVSQNVKPKTPFFALDVDDLEKWINRMMDEYAYLFEGMYW